MLQPRESRLLWRRRKRKHSIEGICSTLAIIGCLTLLPHGLTQHNDDVFIVKPTPALRLGKEELTTVLLVNNENHGRYINVRPEVGLLTSTARTFIQEGVTTEYATQVVGTTLDNGRVYAQYLKKSSRVLYDSGSPVPSVVTSWVGGPLHSDAGFLPQSHNELFDADQPDWQAIDDRLLGDQRHKQDFIGNTDYVGLRHKPSLDAKSFKDEDKDVEPLLGTSLKLDHTTTSSKATYNFVAQLGALEENARKVAANKVLPIGDLPTYTVKQNYESSVFSNGHDKTDPRGNNEFGRSPKFIYKKLMRSKLESEDMYDFSPSSKLVITAASRHFATVTYYGFADFTTVVGDSVIVFSPSTSTNNLNYAHVTSIKGEATLGVGPPQDPSISQVPIRTAQDIIEPTIMQHRTVIETLKETALDVMDMADVEENSNSYVSTSEVSENTNLESNILEMSESIVVQQPSETSSIQSSTTIIPLPPPPPVMLSRPSDEEILRIFSALANADVDKMKTPSNIKENITFANIMIATSSRDEVKQQATASVETFGGATTIFFEDDPFANFVVPSKTNINQGLIDASPTKSFPSLGDDKVAKESSYLNEETKIESPTTTNTIATSNIEVITEQKNSFIQSTSERPVTVATTEKTVDIEASIAGSISSKQSMQDANITPDILPNVLIKEINPHNKDDVPSDCISTSQVFLTQLPKTITLLETIILSDAADIMELKTEVRQQIQPTFEITEATKYYCIQASIIQIDQMETPFVKSTITAMEKSKNADTTSKTDRQSDKEEEEEQEELKEATERYSDENKTEIISNATEDNTVTNHTEEPELREKAIEASTEQSASSKSNINADDDEHEEDQDDDSSGQPEEVDDEDDEEIELIYKTLYTTYTYLTTFFHDDSTSISSHSEIVTNVMTSTLGVDASTTDSLTSNFNANLYDNEINPTSTLASITSTKRFMVPSEVESLIRTDDEDTREESETNSSASATKSDSKTSATFYTTYTYYTTIFADGETEIMSRTEVVTNIKKTQISEMAKITPTSSFQSSLPGDGGSPFSTIISYKENIISNNSLKESEPSSISPSLKTLASSETVHSPNIPDLGDLSAITLITDVRSSSSPGSKQIVNNIGAKFVHDNVQQQQNPIFEDQISSESNTDTDEIMPSATLLLQTSFTTFTYYTTMYSGDKTNIISRLETMTNTVTETLQLSKTINLDAASVPITYFTTFTYWTKLAKEGQITTLSREETISNVITPTRAQQETQTEIENNVSIETEDEAMEKQTTTSTIELSKKEGKDVTTLDHPSPVEKMATSTSKFNYTTNIIEPTTYYTTYTYYTTSYETDKTITNSRFETVTNIITPTLTSMNSVEQQKNSVTLETPMVLSSPSSASTLEAQTHSNNAQSPTELVLYDFKKIIDADGISTIFFTTEIKPTINAEGLSTQVISSSSSLLVNEERRSIQATSIIDSSTSSLGLDGQTQKQYKTGLVRLIEGTRIANRTTTLYQSKVIGTVIDQRYAQIIESTSSFIFEKTKASTDIANLSGLIAITTTSSYLDNIQATEQVSIPINTTPKIVESSIIEINMDQEGEIGSKLDVETDEENSSKTTDEKLRFPFETKKPSFISPLKPFSNRNRPQFAPKKNSSATIITRSDFTPTITATPALKSISRFSSTRRGGSVNGIISSNSALFAVSPRRFGRPSKSSISGTGTQASSSLGAAASRNRFASSSPTNTRGSYVSSTRRLGGSASSLRPSFSRPSLFSSGYPGNSRLRVKPSSTFDLAEATTALDASTSTPLSSQEEENSAAQDAEAEDEEENVTTESNRRQNNPLLRLRRPLNRPQGFTPARPQSNSPNNAVSLRRNPLTSRSRNTGNAVTTTTTSTTAKPKNRSFQPPLIAQNRIRPTNSLFPPRNIFGVQKPVVTTEENRDLSEEDTNENNDDSEYEDEDDEESEGDEEDDINRRRRSNNKIERTEQKQKTRSKREADSSQQNRSNFRNRFRRPKIASLNQAEYKSNEDDTAEVKETVTTVATMTTSTSRTRSRFGARYSGHSSTSSTTSASASTVAATITSNHKTIRPTRPTNSNGGRAQFTLREKDSSAMSTTQKGLTSPKRPAFRRPQPGGGVTSRRLPSSTVPSSSSSTSTSGKRRLKNYTNNDSTTTSRNSVTGRSRPASTTAGRSRSTGPSRDGNIGGRSRPRNNHNYNNNEDITIDNSGTIIVTHIIPAEVTIPVVNGKVTEYKQVVTAKTSTEVLGPQQYTTSIIANGLPQLALTREDSSINYNGATEVTKYILHETPTTTITFTPTTIRGRKTSFSHVLPSTVYSVEQVVTTQQPQISANAPLANILLSQLLLGNVGLPAANPLLGALGGALTQPGLATAVGPPQPATPVTEYKTHASTYVTTVYEGQSTVLPVTFQGKKILTTVFDTTAQTITATEFITDTIVTTPTVMVQPQPVVNSLLLQQILLQQHLQQQQQQLQQPNPDANQALSAILNPVPSQFLLGGDNLQELEVSNNIRGSGHNDILSEDDDFNAGSAVDLDDIVALQAQTQKNGRKKTRKNGKSHKRKNAESRHRIESSVITLYVSGRRPGEFSTVLSTVQVRPDSTQYKRNVHIIDSVTDYLNDGSDIVNEYLALPPEIILLDASQDTHKQYQHFDSGQDATNSDAFFPSDLAHFKTSYDYSNIADYSDSDSSSGNNSNNNNSNNEQSQNGDIDEARYNLATRIMSNGVEVIIASNKTKAPDHKIADKPMTLAASTIKNQMMILLFPSSLPTTDNSALGNQPVHQLNYKLPFHTNHFITKTCLTTYTYRTTYVQDGRTTVESREKVISNIATEERNYPKITPTQPVGVTLTKTPELAVGIFPTIYSYFNTFKDNNDKLQVMSSEYTVVNTITGPNDYVAYLQPTAKATPALKTNTYYNEVTFSQQIKSKMYTVKRNLTQVVVTKSYTPEHSTSVTTSYYAYDDISSADIKGHSVTAGFEFSHNEEGEAQAASPNDTKTKLVDDIHIYATKIFSTTFTYYTTTVLNSFSQENNKTDLDIKPMSTVFNYYTRVIENVITDSVPATLLPNKLLTKMKLQLGKERPNQRRRLVIVTTATLKDGQTVKISAIRIYKGNLASVPPSLTPTPLSPTALPLLQTEKASLDHNSQEGFKEEHYLNQESDEVVSGDFQPEESSSPNFETSFENFKHPENHEEGAEDNNDIASLSSEQILTVVDVPNKQATSNAHVPEATNEIPSTTAGANQLIQRLTALKPMFNAMADLLQNNFKATRESIKPLPMKNIESKQATNKKINSSSLDSVASDLKHPIYIPVQKSPLRKSPTEYANYTEFIPQSLHIKPPPLLVNNEDDFEMNYNEKTSIIPLGVLTAPRQEQPLHNGGIYIRPGEVITANSDVIIGKPNGIEYAQIPNHLQIVKNTSKSPFLPHPLDNRQFKVTYYHNKVQHTYKKKSPSALTSFSHKHPLIPINNSNNNLILHPPAYGLRPPNEQHFNKNILKPPPAPSSPTPILHTSIPIHSQPQGLSVILTAPPDKTARTRSKLPTSTGAYFSAESNLRLPPQSLLYMMPDFSPSSVTPPPPPDPPSGKPNFYKLNSELKNNEILEIQQIPQVLSVDIIPSSMQNLYPAQLSNTNRKPLHQPQSQSKLSSHKKMNSEQTSFIWPNKREPQNLSTYIRWQKPQSNNIQQREKEALPSEHSPKFVTISNGKTGEELVLTTKPSTTSNSSISINLDQETRLNDLTKNPQSATNSQGSTFYWNLENDRQPQNKIKQFPFSYTEKGEIPPHLQRRPPHPTAVSTSLPYKEMYFQDLPPAPHIKLNFKSSSNPMLSNDNKVSKQTNESATKNRQNVSLNHYSLSHTVDVNVPPLTFKREDHDYPKQAATAVMGQIPPATIKELKTPADNAYKYMPLITIPAHEQQVQVSLTPIGLQNGPDWIKLETAASSDNVNTNILHKISLLNDNHKRINDQDQKTFATNNILHNKPKTTDENVSAKQSHQHPRKQQPNNSYGRLSNKSHLPITTTRPGDSHATSMQKTKEQKSKIEQDLKSNQKPKASSSRTTSNQTKQNQTLISKQTSVYKYPSVHLTQHQSLATSALKIINNHTQSHQMEGNKSRWSVSQGHHGEKKNHYSFPSTEHEMQTKNYHEQKQPETTTTATAIQEMGQLNHNINYRPTVPSPPPTTPTMKSELTLQDIGKIVRHDQQPTQITQLLAHGEPFRKPSHHHNNRKEGVITNQQNKTTAAIFIAPGETFRTSSSNTENAIVKITTKQSAQVPTNKISSNEQSTLANEIFVSRETQYALSHSKKTPTTSARTPLDMPSEPSRTTTSKVNNTSTQIIFDLYTPPPKIATNSNTTTQIVMPTYSLSNGDEKSYTLNTSTATSRRQTNMTSQVEPNIVSKMSPGQLKVTNTTVVAAQQHTNFEGQISNLEAAKSHNYHSQTATEHFQNGNQKPRESFTLSILQPSEYYEAKVLTTTTSTASTSPLVAVKSVQTLTTTTTINRIILPTKYITNKRVYTVTTTATAAPLPTPPLSSIYLQTTSYLSTTETTTEVTTLFLTHTKINTIVDTVTSVKTLDPVTITTTTTLKPSSSHSIENEFTSVRPSSPVLVSQSSSSPTFPSMAIEPKMPEIIQDLTYSPYPSVEVVSTNITSHETAGLNPDENSIFIIMTNHKNKKNSLFHNRASSHAAAAEHNNNIGSIDGTNDVMIEYDNGLSFDDIYIRDEEPGQIVNGKSVKSSAFVNNNNNVVNVKDSSSGDHVILGGVLIATPPKLPPIHYNFTNESVLTNSGCHPKCKASRNEQCGLVDNHWSCHCRPGFARMFPDRPCKPTYTYDLLMHAERVGNYPLQYVNELKNHKTEHFKQLTKLINNALDRMIMQSDLRDAYHGVEVTHFADVNKDDHGILINILLQLSDNSNDKRLEEVLKKNLRLSNYSIGGTDLFTNKIGVDTLAIKDFNECLSRKLHDCSENAHCFNLPGTYTCSCVEGFVDLSDNPIYPGRICSAEQIGCELCHYHGQCSTLIANPSDRNYCECFPWYAGSNCQVNLKILLIVLLGIGTLLFILLLFCILITCTKRRNHLQHTVLAPSTLTSTSSEGLQKNSKLAANMVIESVGLRGSIRGVRLKTNNNNNNSKRHKTIKIDKRSMIKDSSSEASHSSLPYILKNRESIASSCNKKKLCLLKHCKKYRNYGSQINTIEKYSVSLPTTNIQIENQSDLNTVVTTSSSFKRNNQQMDQKNLLGNANDYEGHYCEQSDRSLTVMIPRAKYHSSVLSQAQLMHHQLTMERVQKTGKPENKLENTEKEAEVKRNHKTNSSTVKVAANEERRLETPTNPGALISAGFEVSAIVRDNMAVKSGEQQHNDYNHRFNSVPQNYITNSDPATSLESNPTQKHLPSEGRQQQYMSSKKFSTTESDYNGYKCEKDLIETMDEWLGNVKRNELSAEARSFDETTIRASTKPLHVFVDGSQTHQLHDEVNTMAERDLGSTFLLPHTHLYKPERESELSGFDSF